MSDEARPELNAEPHTDDRRTRGPFRALGAMLQRTIHRVREAIRARLGRRGGEAPVGQPESLPTIRLAVDGTRRLLDANARLTTGWPPRRETPTRLQPGAQPSPYTWQLPRSPAEGFAATVRSRYLPSPPPLLLAPELPLAPPRVRATEGTAPRRATIPGARPEAHKAARLRAREREEEKPMPTQAVEPTMPKPEVTPRHLARPVTPPAEERRGERVAPAVSPGLTRRIARPVRVLSLLKDRILSLSKRRAPSPSLAKLELPPVVGPRPAPAAEVPRQVAPPPAPIGEKARAAREQARTIARRKAIPSPTRRPIEGPRPTPTLVPRFPAVTTARPASAAVSRKAPLPPLSVARPPHPPPLPGATPWVTTAPPAPARRHAAIPTTQPTGPTPPTEVGPLAPTPITRKPARPTEAAPPPTRHAPPRAAPPLAPRPSGRQPTPARTMRFKPRIGQRVQRPRLLTRLPRAPAAHPTEPGRPLPPPVRATMEHLLGSELGPVRVRTGPEAARAAAELRAEAFTTEQEIFFGAERARFETPSGLALLSHELAHVRQRMGVTRPRIPSALRAQAEEEEAQQIEETVRRTLGPGPTIEPLTLLSVQLAGGPTQEGEAVRRTVRHGLPQARPIIPASRPARPSRAKLELAAAPAGRAGATEAAPSTAGPVAPVGAAETGEEAAPPEVDVTAIAAQVYEIIKRRLTIERERSGKL